MKQINVRLHMLTIIGILILLRWMQLHPVNTFEGGLSFVIPFWSWFTMLVGVLFIFIGDYAGSK